MNLLITSKEQILAELTNIDSFLNITMSEDVAEAVQRGNDLAVYVARSGKLLADSKYWLNEIRGHADACRHGKKCESNSDSDKCSSQFFMSGREILS